MASRSPLHQALKITSLKGLSLAQQQNTAQGGSQGPRSLGQAPLPLAENTLPSASVSFPEKWEEHLLLSRCSGKEGPLPWLHPGSSMQGGWRGAVGTEVPRVCFQPLQFPPSLRPRHMGWGSFICVHCWVKWGVLPLGRKMTHWAMSQAPWERPGQPQARAPGSPAAGSRGTWPA